MKEAHEVERILKQLLGMKVVAAEIQTLPLGHFYAAIGNDVKKVYVLPVGVPESVGVEVARGIRTPESVRDNFLKRKVMEVSEDLVWREKYEELKRDFTSLQKDHEKLKNALAESKTVEEQTKELKEENVRLRDDLKSLDARFVKAQKDAEAVEKIREGLMQLLPTNLPTGSQALVVTESIPELHHKIARPVVETDESTHEGRLITLALHGFFDEKRRVTAIAKKITEVYAVQVNMKALNDALESVVQKKVLQREEASNGGWEYWLFPGAKERIKEAKS
jgi:regulator of replication initiation timing